MRKLPELEEIDVYDCPAVLQQAEDKDKPGSTGVRVKFFNRDEENSRALSSSMEMQVGKQCVIL